MARRVATIVRPKYSVFRAMDTTLRRVGLWMGGGKTPHRYDLLQTPNNREALLQRQDDEKEISTCRHMFGIGEVNTAPKELAKVCVHIIGTVLIFVFFLAWACWDLG